MAGKIWHYSANGQQIGPHSIDEIMGLIQMGRLPQNVLVWRDGLSNWVAASSLPEFSTMGNFTYPPTQQPDNSFSGILYYNGLNLAGFGPRAAASLIDWVILIIPTQLISYLIRQNMISNLRSVRNQQEFDSLVFTTQVEVFLMAIIINWVYKAATESSEWQATLGKKALNLKVTDENGYRINFGQASGRYFATLLSTLILLIGYFMMLWSPKRQTLHDQLAGTLVIQEKPANQYPQQV